jgi:hypothetical protein
LSYHRQDTVQVLKHIIVLEPHNDEPFISKPSFPIVVFTLRYCMLTAIEFNDDAFFETDEIDYKITDRLLPSEFYAVQLSGP